MLLRADDATLSSLWEGELELDESIEARNERGSLERAQTPPADALRNLPVCSIGHPEVWSLWELYDPGGLPPALRVKSAESNFYLVRFSCSFRPKRGDTQVEWARFGISLLPDEAGRTAIAFDLHPLLVSHEKKRNVNVTLGPTLKFQEVEAGLGNVGFGLQYVVLEPVISAAGVGETEPSWDYQAAPGMDLTGSKWMHLLVKAPKEMETGAARLDLAADLVKDRFRIPLVARPKPTMADPLTVRLWGA